MKIYYIRHGETEWSISGRHTGTTDIPLTEQGEAMAETLQATLAVLPIARVFTSPRQRAQHTCALAGLAAKAVVTDDLAEWDYGDYEGITSKSIRAIQPDWDIFRDGCPNGETPSQIAARADRLIAAILAGTGDVALFSHGHFGRVFAARWIDMALPTAAHLAIDPASIAIFEHMAGHVPPRQMICWNKTVS